jgi:AcrR family transcriptional regulator
MSIAVDARVVRTREALQQAMVDLAAEAPLDAITVRAIATRAGVGYATFFRHYADKEALLADVADTLTVSFLAQVRPLLLQKDRRGAARQLCAFVEAHLPIHQALIAGGAGETVRAGMLRQTLETLGRTRASAPGGPLDELLLFHLTSSILNLLAWWLRNRDRVDAETMAEIIERAVLTPVGAIGRQPPGGLPPA